MGAACARGAEGEERELDYSGTAGTGSSGSRPIDNVQQRKNGAVII